ncbi:MAG: protein TonB [Saprospiraceae bacterium]|jgi:protein TonB
MLDLTINGKEFAVGITVLAGLIALVIFALRSYLKKKSEDLNVKEILHPAARNKKPQVDALRWSATILRGGLVVSLAMTVLAFSWTTYDNDIYIPDYEKWEEDMTEIIPPTDHPKPPPPPLPPPPTIVEVPNETDIEQPDMIDQTISEVDAVIAPAPVTTPKAPAPPIFVPTPVIEDGPPIMFAEKMPMFSSTKCNGIDTYEESKACAEKEMLQFIYKYIKYPAIARENNIQGTTVIRFVVSKTGKVQQIEILKDLAGGCGKEALRVVNKMPKWKPGRQGGRNVAVYFNLPIKFQLEN